jgi:hypothetical protein
MNNKIKMKTKKKQGILKKKKDHVSRKQNKATPSSRLKGSTDMTTRYSL